MKVKHFIDLQPVVDGAEFDYYQKFQCPYQLEEGKETLNFMFETIKEFDIGRNLYSVEELADAFYKTYIETIASQQEVIEFDAYPITNTESITTSFPTRKGQFYISRLYHWLAHHLVTLGLITLCSPKGVILSLEQLYSTNLSWTKNTFVFFSSYYLIVEEYP